MVVDDDDSLAEKQVQRAVEQPDGHVGLSWSLRRKDDGALLLLLLPSVVWRMPVSALLRSRLELYSCRMLLRMAEAEISGRLARAMDASMDDGGSFMVGLMEECAGFQQQRRGWLGSD